jgi:hypothetical protein
MQHQPGKPRARHDPALTDFAAPLIVDARCEEGENFFHRQKFSKAE